MIQVEHLLKDNIANISVLLNKVNINRHELLRNCINEKLNANLYKYVEDIRDAEDFLNTKGDAKIMQALHEMQKQKDLAALQEAIDNKETNNND